MEAGDSEREIVMKIARVFLAKKREKHDDVRKKEQEAKEERQ